MDSIFFFFSGILLRFTTLILLLDINDTSLYFKTIEIDDECDILLQNRNWFPYKDALYRIISVQYA